MKVGCILTAFLFLPTLTFSATIYVPDDYPTIQEAIDASSDGDTVIVRSGIYQEWNIRFKHKRINVKSSHGPEFTIIDGRQMDAVFVMKHDEGPDSILDGFTIMNGKGNGNIVCDNTSPTIINNIVTDHLFGAGIYVYRYSNPKIYNNIIINNQGFNGGGVVCLFHAAPVIANNFISYNTAESRGGGIFCESGAARILSNTIIGNTASDGGGLYSTADSPAIQNNIIARNTAYSSLHGDGLGGALFIREANDAKFSNNTIFDNYAETKGGGLFCYYETNIVVSNSIFWGDDSPLGPEIVLSGIQTNPYPVLTIGYSDVEGGQNSVHVEQNCVLNWTTGMIDADPLFADTTSDDLHLTHPSPCVDSGDATTPGLTVVDFEGDPRIALDAVDMGADEYWFHLYHIGEVIPGSPIEVKVVGYPTAPVTLFFGAGIADPPYPTPHGDFWLKWPPLWAGGIGTVPGDGVLVHSAFVPTEWVSHDQHPLQSLVGPWAGPLSRFTNLMVLTVE